MSTSKAFRILSVEDNPETRLLLKHQLQDSYEVAFASGVDEALNQVETEHFDLLLLDINLGPAKGKDLSRSRVGLTQILTSRSSRTPMRDLIGAGCSFPESLRDRDSCRDDFSDLRKS